MLDLVWGDEVLDMLNQRVKGQCPYGVMWILADSTKTKWGDII